MIYVCVICMVQRPPLAPVEAEYRRLLEAIVSPFIPSAELEACHSHWLLCTNCKIFMQTLYNFQQKALIGLTNLKYLLHKLNTERTIEDAKPVVTIKIERDVGAADTEEEFITIEAPPYVNPLAEELIMKLEPGPPASEQKPEFQECDFGSMTSGDPNTDDRSIHPASISAASTRVQVATVASEGKYPGFVPEPAPSEKPRPPNSRRKDGAREGPKKRVRKKAARVTCPHCVKCVLSSSLKMHMKRKHGESAPCRCDECGKQCRNAVALKIHKSDHIKKAQNRHILDVRPPRPELFCQPCTLQFPTSSLYKAHLTSLKHLPRDQCQFECETCNKRFADDRRRQHHINVVHLGLRHKCEQCDRTFPTPSKVRAHAALAHAPRAEPRAPRHVCHLCGKTFKIRKCLEEHLHTHEGLRPHQCPLCPATFTYKAALYTHNRLKHLKIKRKWRKKKKEAAEEENAGSDD